ncbi:MAG: NUDIX domain-containing protein [Gammaproteobacteria bacterium]|nr:NUDIX domain-containing protein [Gammaproteobacteria bacterium]
MSPYYHWLRNLVGNKRILMPGVAGIVHDEQGRLLLQRKGDGTWSLPAGAIEIGETPSEAMARELLEETGIVASQLRLIEAFGGSGFRYTYSNGHEVEYVILLFYCTGQIQPDAVLDNETVELKYFPKEEFPGLQLPYPIELLYALDISVTNHPPES